MVTDRLEVRLDRESRRKLAAIASAQGVPVSTAVRAMIDQVYEDLARDDRRRAVEELSRLEVEDVPDSEALSQQVADTYAVHLR